MKFDYVERDPEVLASEGRIVVTIAINGDDCKKACGITFPYRYFPVLNVLLAAIVRRFNRWKKVPKGWEKKNISIIGILGGKYRGFNHLKKLVKGAELWTLKKK